MNATLVRKADQSPRSGFRRGIRLFQLRLIRAARGRWAVPALFIGSFVDSTIFPWPVALPLAAQMLRGRRHVFPAAAAAALGSILGGLLIYALARLAFDAVAPFLVDDSASAATLTEVRSRMEAGGGAGGLCRHADAGPGAADQPCCRAGRGRRRVVRTGHRFWAGACAIL